MIPMEIEFLRAAGEVTGSCYLLRCRNHRILLECGQIQGDRDAEELNRAAFAFDPARIDAVILSHAHIDHSGRLPLVVKQGFTGPIHTHHATRELCDIMLADSAWLHEKDAELDNRKRARKGLPEIEPLFTREHAEQAMRLFRGHEYDERVSILPGVEVRFRDAGHILGAAIVEIWLEEDDTKRKIVFSGDLGFEHGPIMAKPENIDQADLVLLESTYGDRDHRSPEDTLAELKSVFLAARQTRGNIIIPAFAVGRTQDLLHLMSQHFDEWRLDDWQVFLDSPMAIEATDVYSRFRHLYSARLFQTARPVPVLRNLAMSRTPEDSMAINRMESGAIVIAGSGMCTGGRVLHHLKHNLWRKECHIVIVGYQAHGTLGRKLVDGVEYVKIWGETIRANARIHTVGGLSAHADRSGLIAWYAGFEGRPPVCLVHG
ncbi:MAG: MBL fold metallo-hydrolase, partial [Gammaproteobacteria bacterium]